MKSGVIIIVRTKGRKAAVAVQQTMRAEDYEKVSDIKATRQQLLGAKKDEVFPFVISEEGDWTVITSSSDILDMELAKAITGETNADGWIIEQQPKGKLSLWPVEAGQAKEQPQFMTQLKVDSYLKTAGVDERLINFDPIQHLSTKDSKLGRHEDILLGFSLEESKDEEDKGDPNKSETERALEDSNIKKKQEILDIEKFLERAVKHKKVRDIARAQIEEQLKGDGYADKLRIIDPEPQGHHCEAYDAESYSFTSNGPYAWFDWSCEEACEPDLVEEKAFPTCDLHFKLEKSGEL